ncbi:MAG: tetratricopeptide repeat protein [Sulfuritalea sp.]|nr:tetratricopeptide repeat protein [Sulfuritalea sp.]
MFASLHSLRTIAILCGLILIVASVGCEPAWGQASTLSPAEKQQILDRVKDADLRKDWRELRKIGEEVIARDPTAWGGWYWKGLGQFNLLEFRESISAFKETVRLSPSNAFAWNNICAAYTGLGEIVEAVEACEKATQVDPKLAIAWSNLWGGYNSLGNRDKVREAYQRLKELDPEKTRQAIAKFGVPEDAALPVQVSSTEIVGAGDASAIRDALAKLDSAEALITQERIAESLPLLEVAFKTLTANLGAGSEEALRARDYLMFAYADLSRLGDVLALVGPRNYKNAVVRFRQIHGRRIARYGESSEKAVLSGAGLAYALDMSGETGEAQQLVTKTYAIAIALLGEEHRATLTAALVRLAMYMELGQYEEAVAAGERLVSVSRRNYGESDPLTVTALSELGSSYVANRKPSDGIPHLELALELNSRLSGESSRQTIVTMSSLGTAYASAGRPDEALKILERAAQISEKAFGRDSPDTADSLLSLVLGYFQAKRLGDASNVSTRATEIYSKSLGPNHPRTINSRTILAMPLMLQGRRNEAMEILAGAVRSVEALRLSSDFSPEERQSFFSKYATFYRLYAVLLAASRPDESFRIGELSKARTLLESTAMRRANDSGLLGEADALKVKWFETRIGDVNDRIANVSVNRSLKAKFESEKATLIHDFAEFRADLVKRNPKYGQLSDVRIIGAEEGREVLPSDAVFLSYLEVGGAMLAFALDTANGLVTKLIPQVPGLKEKLEKYRAMLADPDARDSIVAQPSRNLTATAVPKTDPKSLQELSEFLGTTLLDPFAAQIRQEQGYHFSGWSACLDSI